MLCLLRLNSYHIFLCSYCFHDYDTVFIFKNNAYFWSYIMGRNCSVYHSRKYSSVSPFFCLKVYSSRCYLQFPHQDIIVNICVFYTLRWRLLNTFEYMFPLGLMASFMVFFRPNLAVPLSLSKNHKIFNFISIVLFYLFFIYVMKLYLLIQKGIGILCCFLLIKITKLYEMGNWIRPLLQVSWFFCPEMHVRSVTECLRTCHRDVLLFFTFDKTFDWSHSIFKKERKPKHSSGETLLFLYEKLHAWISSIWHEITETDVNKHTDNC